MTVSASIGLVAAAGVIGFTHGLEPDHVAGISALTGGLDDARLAAVVGGCFALGHVLLVVAWLVGGFLLLGWTSFPLVFETVGLVVAGVLLVGLSAALGAPAARRLVHKHEHDHGGRVHTHVHLHGRGGASDHEGADGHHHEGVDGHHHEGGDGHHHEGGDGHHHEGADGHHHEGVDGHHHEGVDGHHHEGVDGHHHEGAVGHHHEHTVSAYLEIGVVGALFTVSPPLSMIVFVSVVVTSAPAAVVVAAVLAYTASITTTMSLVGYGAGTAFRLAQARGPRVHAALQLAVAGIVLAVGTALLGHPLVFA